MNRAFFLAVPLVVVLAPACSAAPAGGSDAGPRDAGRSDAPVVDVRSGSDAVIDTGALDASDSTDTGTDDGSGGVDVGASDDAAPIDGGSPADGGASCDYLDLDIWIVSCGGRDLYARRFTVPSGSSPACPDYFTLGTMSFGTLDAALASQSCQTDCLRAASTSVSLLRCGRRTGYIVFRDPEDSCPDVYETPDGLFGSVAEWDAAFPCP